MLSVLSSFIFAHCIFPLTTEIQFPSSCTSFPLYICVSWATMCDAEPALPLGNRDIPMVIHPDLPCSLIAKTACGTDVESRSLGLLERQILRVGPNTLVATVACGSDIKGFYLLQLESSSLKKEVLLW
jgi:hypothetical protein